MSWGFTRNGRHPSRWAEDEWAFCAAHSLILQPSIRRCRKSRPRRVRDPSQSFFFVHDYYFFFISSRSSSNLRILIIISHCRIIFRLIADLACACVLVGALVGCPGPSSKIYWRRVTEESVQNKELPFAVINRYELNNDNSYNNATTIFHHPHLILTSASLTDVRDGTLLWHCVTPCPCHCLSIERMYVLV